MHCTKEIWQKQWKTLIKCDKNTINNEDDTLICQRQELWPIGIRLMDVHCGDEWYRMKGYQIGNLMNGK